MHEDKVFGQAVGGSYNPENTVFTGLFGDYKKFLQKK